MGLFSIINYIYIYVFASFFLSKFINEIPESVMKYKIQINITPDENPDLPVIVKMLMKNPPKPKSEAIFSCF